ncbi:hypothetical protein FRB93_012503 [Tulasnella sp. JGI-2019a]|nr:hypothetical protein FRB93_012503 [Tulasnella sp. JGI-2019a]
MQRLQDMPLGTPLPQVQVHVIVTNNSIPSSTTGGKGGSTVTVTTLAALTSAVTGDTATILVSGTITGNVVVEIGSNKSVIGKAGAYRVSDAEPHRQRSTTSKVIFIPVSEVPALILTLSLDEPVTPPPVKQARTERYSIVDEGSASIVAPKDAVTTTRI